MQLFKSISKTVAHMASATSHTYAKAEDRDPALQSFEKQLLMIQNYLNVVRQQFQEYTEALTAAVESSVALSKTVLTFYSDVEHEGTHESVKHYHGSQDEVATEVVKMIQDERGNHDGVVSQIDTWNLMIEVALRKIKECEDSRCAALTTSRRLKSLQTQYKLLSAKALADSDAADDAYYDDIAPLPPSTAARRSSVGSSATECAEDSEEMRKLKAKMKETSKVKQSLVRDFDELKSQVTHLAEDMIDSRFKQFDQMFVQLLECQKAFFSVGFEMTAPFDSVIKYYRSKYPKSRSESVDDTDSTDSKAAPPKVVVPDKGSAVKGASPSKPKPPTGPSPAEVRAAKRPQTAGPKLHERPPQRTRTRTVPTQEHSAPPKKRTPPVTRQESRHRDILGMDWGFMGAPTAAAATTATASVPNGTGPVEDDLFGSFTGASPASDGADAFGSLFGDSATASTTTAARPVATKPVLTGSVPSEDFFSSMFGAAPTSAGTSAGSSAKSLASAPPPSSGIGEDDMFGFGSLGGTASVPAKASAPVATKKKKPATASGTRKTKAVSGAGRGRRSGGGLGVPSTGASAMSGSKSTSSIDRAPFLVGFSDDTGAVKHSVSVRTRSLTPDARGRSSGGGEEALGSAVRSRSQDDGRRASDGSAAKKAATARKRRQAFAHDRFREVTAMYAEEDAALAKREDAMDSIETDLDTWEFDKYGKRRNIQNLFANLHTVLWEGCRWKKVSFTTDMKALDRYYKKACMIIHPDKCKQKGLDSTKTAIAERAFTAINEAYMSYKDEHGIQK